MFLSDFSIKRPVAAVVIIITLMGLGLIALSKLRVNQNPDVALPLIVVSIAYPGASPDTVEREILNRIEKTFQGIEGVDQERSQATAREGMAEFVLFFDFHKDLTQAADEIRNAIGTVRYKLPIEMREPVLTRIDPSSDPIMSLALSSDKLSHAELSHMAEDQLADRFRAIPGVSNVDIAGARTRELSVLLHSQKLREFGVSVTDVVNALRAQNANAPVGKVRGSLVDQSIRLVGRIESPGEFNQMPVKRNGDTLIRLGQVATVQDGFAEDVSHNERDGRLDVGLYVSRTRDSSTVTVAKAVREMVKTFNAEPNQHAKLEITRDGGEDAQDSLNNVIHSLFFGAGLTVLVVYVFLNSWRSTLITGLSLPTSVLTAFIAVWLCGFTLNFMSLLRWIDTGRPLELFGDGTQSRDFTFVDDIARGTIAALKPLGYEVINLGGGRNPIRLTALIEKLETLLGKKAVYDRQPFHVADIKETWADIGKAERLLGWKPRTGIDEGLQQCVEWYRANRSWVNELKF